MKRLSLRKSKQYHIFVLKIDITNFSICQCQYRKPRNRKASRILAKSGIAKNLILAYVSFISLLETRDNAKLPTCAILVLISSIFISSNGGYSVGNI